MNKRMILAALALVGVFVTTYLTLFKLGYIGTMTCSVGSCATVQLSEWAVFLGLPVAAWGLGFYVTTLAVALIGTQERFADSRMVSLALTAMSGWGVLFSGWLTYLEAFVINAWCQWCVVSAIIVLLIFVVSLLDLREVRMLGRDEPAPLGDEPAPAGELASGRR
jgi:uncharacterized membrane protein